MIGNRIALFGGSFNPPGLHHRLIAERLISYFDLIYVIPCGMRVDKASVNRVLPQHRLEMVKATFFGLPKVQLILDDLEQNIFTPTCVLQERFAKEGEVWHAIGTDLIIGGHDGRSEIHRVWQKGPEIWQQFNFFVITRDDFDHQDLPPNYMLLQFRNFGSSTEIRQRLQSAQSVAGLVVPEVEKYIYQHGLYQAADKSVV